MTALLPMLDGAYAPYLPGFVLFILLFVAAWDARTGIVPDSPMAIGALVMFIGRFTANGWQDAYAAFGWALLTWIIIFAINEIWYRLFGKDAVGMGDAKWTALAVLAFGGIPATFAWFAGAWISIIWIVLCYATNHKIAKVYFAPFLFCGLLIGLAVTRHVITLPAPFYF